MYRRGLVCFDCSFGKLSHTVPSPIFLGKVWYALPALPPSTQNNGKEPVDSDTFIHELTTKSQVENWLSLPTTPLRVSQPPTLDEATYPGGTLVRVYDSNEEENVTPHGRS